MSDTRRGLVLIGMPGCGKSTVGRLAADALGWAFVDLDREIERVAGVRLRDINAREGFAGLQRRERAAALALAVDEPAVVAPGGSVVYDADAMDHLQTLGRVVYLDVPAAELERRAGDLVARGVMIRPGMTYLDLVAERDPLYRRFAHTTHACGLDDAFAVAAAVVTLVTG